MRIVAAALALVLASAAGGGAQEGAFLSEEEAPAAVFPDAKTFDRHVVDVTPARRERVAAQMDGVGASQWEERWVVYQARRGDAVLGDAVIVEEIGKHRPITFVVGVRPDGSVADVAVMAYREAYGGEVQSPRFLGQYQGKRPHDSLKPYGAIKNIAGATLSVEAASRAVRKGQAVAAVLRSEGL